MILQRDIIIQQYFQEVLLVSNTRSCTYQEVRCARDMSSFKKDESYIDQVGSEIQFVPPHRYAIVSPGIIRGAYPNLMNFDFLIRRNLKTILNFTPHSPTADLMEFCDEQSCSLEHFVVELMAPMDESLAQTFADALKIVCPKGIDPGLASTSSTFIHCLDGRRITGIFVLCIRRLQQWTALSAISEYWRFHTYSRSALIQQSDVNKVSVEMDQFVDFTLRLYNEQD